MYDLTLLLYEKNIDYWVVAHVRIRDMCYDSDCL